MMAKKSIFLTVCVALFLIVMSVLAMQTLSTSQVQQGSDQQRQALAELKFYLFKKPRIIAPVALENMKGESKPFTEHLSGWRLVNFGYMFCPDICPLNLASLNTVKTQWDKQGSTIPLDVLHVTFDPVRDTPDQLSQYLDYLNPQFYGLTGSLENIRQVAQQMNMVFIHEKPDKNGHYFITHSDSIALINPKGEYVGMFKGPYNTNNMLKALAMIIDF